MDLIALIESNPDARRKNLLSFFGLNCMPSSYKKSNIVFFHLIDCSSVYVQIAFLGINCSSKNQF
jgi:hypothetical protein